MTTTRTAKRTKAVAKKPTGRSSTISSLSSRQQLRAEWKASLKVWSAPKGKTYKHPSKTTLISKSEAKKEYKLDNDDLDSIPVEDKVNRDKRPATTMVFDLSDVQELARRKCEKLGVELPEVLMQDQEEGETGDEDAEGEDEEECREESEQEVKKEEISTARKKATKTSSEATELESPTEPGTDRAQFREWLANEWKSSSRGRLKGSLIRKTEAKSDYRLSEAELGCLPSQEKMEPKKIRGRQDHTQSVVFSLADVTVVAKKKCEMLGLRLPKGLQP
ncbi:hypothetical protein GYMLUDRAFT_263226 [Collybiopsis luxurians FD-317 M1]|uniref:Unplaced genomic scaffold GYMLUscaffold_44, whole genome shotgun sequence n=1 Tax=Collybiopsis luxurians FD-317 M1 TaxID=944289 RepID=A0A0D0CPD2_9AGAR|nr:hypothetical protein GYMLUDRAFT_263226 [Collybiopsis luxurians FD-317 M1]